MLRISNCFSSSMSSGFEVFHLGSFLIPQIMTLGATRSRHWALEETEKGLPCNGRCYQKARQAKAVRDREQNWSLVPTVLFCAMLLLPFSAAELLRLNMHADVVQGKGGASIISYAPSLSSKISACA